MAGKEGYQRVMTVDDGATWFPVEDGENSSSEAGNKVGNVCESTVEMCSKAIGSKDCLQNGAECLSPEQKFDSLVAFYENAYRNAQIDELDRILEDDNSNEFQRAAVANLRQRLMIAQGLIAPDNGNY